MFKNKTTKGKCHVRIHLKDVNQGHVTHGLGYKLTVQGNSDNHVLSQLAGAKMQQTLFWK